MPGRRLADTISVADLKLADLRQVIRDELDEVVKSRVEDRLKALEEQIQQMSEMKETVGSLETSLNHASSRIDDLYKVSLPALAAYVEKVATALALQTLDIDVHRRKWSLSIQGLDGASGEDEDETRRRCVEFARQKLGIAAAKEEDLAACHRLKQEANAAITIRFRDLRDRSRWLSGARNLKNHPGCKVSLSPDLPPVLRPAKKDLLKIRKDLPDGLKFQAGIRYLPHWPYVQLAVPGRDKQSPDITKRGVVEKVLNIDTLLPPITPEGEESV